MTLMMNSFGPSPRIMRLFCNASVHEKGSAEYASLSKLFETEEQAKGNDWQKDGLDMGTRSVIVLDVWKAQTSCGYGVPIQAGSVTEERAKVLTKFAEGWLDRDTLPGWGKKMDDKGVMQYWEKNNFRSLDGLPGLKAARKARGEIIGVAEMGNWANKVMWQNFFGVLLGIMIALGAMFAFGLVNEARMLEIGDQIREMTKVWADKIQNLN